MCLRFKVKLLERVRRNAVCQDNQDPPLPETSSSDVNVEELLNAEKEIISNVQKKTFKDELTILQQTNESSVVKNHDTNLKKTSPLSRLDPFVDSDGIIRVGGRIKYAELPDSVKHPYILPKRGQVTSLVICYYHCRIHHQGRGMTLAAIRSSGFWIIGGSTAVAGHISKCVTCRKLRAVTQVQKWRIYREIESNLVNHSRTAR